MGAGNEKMFFNTLLDALPDAAIVVDGEGNIVLLNSRLEEYLGYCPDELLGNTMEVLVPPSLRDAHTRSRENYLKNPAVRRMGELLELSIMHKDGTPLPADISLSPLEFDGEPFVMAVMHDIRPYKEMEAALKQSEEKYRLLVENASEVFYQIQLADDPKVWEVLFVSQQVEQVLGISQDDFVNDPNLWFQSIHPDDLADVLRVTQGILSRQEKGTRVYRLNNAKTNEYRWIEDHVVPRFDEHGKIIGFQGVMRDVTEREQTTKAIQDLTNQLQHYLTTSPTITYALDAATPVWKPLWVSENVNRILGYQIQDALTSTWWNETVHPEDIEWAVDRSKELFEKDSLVREYRFVRKDGSLIWVNDELRLLRDRDGNPLEAVGSWTDITERRKMEEALLVSEQHLSDVMNSAPFGAITSELQNDDSFVIKNMNDTACRVLGLERDKTIGEKIDDVFTAFPHTEFPLMLQEVARNGKKIHVAQAPYVDGKINGVFELHAVQIDVNTAVVFFRNITELAQAYEETLEGWSRAMDYRDKETEGHTQRVTQMALRMAQAMNLPETDIMHMRRGSLLHDMGKMAIPDSILLKQDTLTEQEWIIMRKHPEFAYEMLRSISFLHQALEIPYCHHEKWDGSGYPRGLKGEEIPLAARIFAVADVWDALSYDRPYRKSWPGEKVREYIREQSGKHFDPRIVDIFLKIDKGSLI